MNKQDLARLVNILENQYLRGGQTAKEAEQIILILLGKEHGKELIKLWNSLIINNN